jgi:hypothetical protein
MGTPPVASLKKSFVACFNDRRMLVDRWASASALL